MSVVVVGGGLAGVTAALDCAGAGLEVTLLESRGRLGGAVYSFSRGELSVDNGQHVFLRCCTEYLDFLRRVGARELVALQPRLSLPVLAPDGRRATLSRTNAPAPLHMAKSLVRYRLLSLSSRLRVVRAMQALRRIDTDDPEVDARAFGEWLAEQRQDPDALETVWNLIARPTLNLLPEAASLAQAAQVFQVGLLHDTAAADLGYATVPLSEIHDRAARRALVRAGVRVCLRSGATSISRGPGSVHVERSGAPTVEGRALILAVPPGRAAALLPAAAGLDAARLRRLGTSPIVNLHVVYDRRVLEAPFTAAVHSPVQWVFDRTESGRVSSGQYLAVSLSAAEEELSMSVEALRERFLPALEELLPAARGATVTAFFVTREHAATFRAAPGARRYRPGPRTQVENVVLAGSWTDTGWPATMESAVRSGHAAAREVMELARKQAWPPSASAQAREGVRGSAPEPAGAAP